MSRIRKKIGLFLSAPPHGGGALQYSQSILQAILELPNNHYEIVVACASNTWHSLIQKYPIKILTLSSNGFLWQCFSSRKFLLLLEVSSHFWRKWCKYFIPDVRKILNENCDLWIFPAQDTWSYILPVTSLSVIHDLMHRYERKFPEVSRGLMFRQREKHYENVCHYSKGILVDSKVGKTHVMESYKVSDELIYVLPYIAPSYIDNKEEICSKSYNLPSKFFFYPAQFWKHKNHEQLVRSIGCLRQRIPDIRMVFAGSPKNAYEEIKMLVFNLGLSDHITFLGYVPDEYMATIYRRARALIMPTYFGPTNIPPLEAFASGCPVAISKIYGMPEQVGDAALLFDPSSDTEIADVMYRLWTDDELCHKLSLLGRQRSELWSQHHFNVQFHAIVKAVTSENNQ